MPLPLLMVAWMAIAAILAPNGSALVRSRLRGHHGRGGGIPVTGAVLGWWRTDAAPDALTRSRLRWIAGRSTAATVISIAFWHLPEILTGSPVVADRCARTVAWLPFVLGIAAALRRHPAVRHRAAGQPVVGVRDRGGDSRRRLRGSGRPARQRAQSLRNHCRRARGGQPAALALAPLRNLAQRTVNRLMYGERDDPAGVLARLGTRMQAVMLPDEVLPAVVETVAPVAAAAVRRDRSRGWERHGFGSLPSTARRSEPFTQETLSHHGADGRPAAGFRTWPRRPARAGRPELVSSLAGEIGPAVSSRATASGSAAVPGRGRCLAGGRAAPVAHAISTMGWVLRWRPSVSRRGWRRREVATRFGRSRPCWGEIDTEVKASIGDIRRLVEALRPPALDELGLLGAVRSRAAALAGRRSRSRCPGRSRPAALPAAIETAAYRIAVEAMTNAVRHSGAAHCDGVDRRSMTTPSRWSSGTTAHGLVADRKPGVGLRSMQERAAGGGRHAVGNLGCRAAPSLLRGCH